MSKKPPKAAPPAEIKTLTVPERAVLALGYNEQATAELTTLAEKNAHIVAITNDDGRKQADRARLDLRAARLAITNKGKDAREDATAYSKAVIAEETRLVAIVKPEEERLAQLVDDFDAAVEREKQRKIVAEQARVDGISARITEIRDLYALPVNPSQDRVREQIAKAESVVLDESFDEFQQSATEARAYALSHLNSVLADVIQREAAAEQSRKDAEELTRLRAEAAERKKADDEAAERERLRLADEADANLRADNQGHGHVRERPDGRRARCGGPGLCDECSREKAALAKFREPLESNSACVSMPAPQPTAHVEGGGVLSGSAFVLRDAPATVDVTVTDAAGGSETVKFAVTQADTIRRPTLEDMCGVLAFHYEVTEDIVLNWLDAAVRGTRRAA